MLPPPTTTAIWIWRSSVTSASWRASPSVASGEMPYSRSGEAKASPESFSRTRRYSGASAAISAQLLAQLEPGEPPARHLLSHLRGDLVGQVCHRLRVVPHE